MNAVFDPTAVATIAEQTVRDLTRVLTSLAETASSFVSTRPDETTGDPGPVFGARPDGNGAGPGTQWAVGSQSAALTEIFRTIDLYADTAKRFVEGYHARAFAPAPTPASAVDHAPLLAAAVEPGGRAQVEWTLGNPTAEPLNDLQPFLTPLLSLAGVIGVDATTIDPPLIEELPPGSERSIHITVEVDAAAESGRYRGLLLLGGFDRSFAVVEVAVVEAPGAEPDPDADGA